MHRQSLPWLGARSNVLFAMLHDGTLYADPAPKNLSSVA